MFRITPHAIKARALLYRRSTTEIQVVAFTRFPPSLKYKDPTERVTCPKPPPPLPPPPKDDRLLWGTVALLFLAGGFAVYAKQNPEIRDWLTLNLPWFDDLIAIAYQENMTYGEFASECMDNIKKYLRGDKPKQCSLDGTPETPIIKESPCDILPPPVVTKDICEIERCLKDLGDSTINNYLTARDACMYYNQLVEGVMVNFSVHSMKKLHEAMAERLALVKVSVDNAKEAHAKLDELSRYFDCGVCAPKEAIENTKSMMKEYQDKIKAVRIEYQWENDKSIVIDRQWLMVEETVDQYTTENETMFTGLKYDHKKPAIQSDADLLLHHTLRYVNQLKEELCEARCGITDRVNRALETLPQDEKSVKATNAAMQAGLKTKRADMEKEFKKRADDQKAANEKKIKDSLKKQLERHQETLQLRLAQKEIEATAKLDILVVEKVEAQKRVFANQLKEMAMKLKIVEDKLNARLKAERETRRSQELWTAGASLLAATKKGDRYVNIDKELNAIEKASGDGDKLVATVLKSIPKSIREQGIVPESVLRDRYHVMERTALKVALVEQDGASMPIYWFSWLQSVFLFMKISGIPMAEYEKPPKEPSKDLDTFDLLQRARFWIERGNIAAALRYVDSLQGASRAAASTWYNAAKAHIEVRQAAEAILAHAAALGLQYI
ncbi:hypothetical protein K1T71_013630 [Dendrolimus kikuchii]|uniref:Uncharacterized protein n=1 Tax=Dendrolimus kikuchii TaxID=765133 RepID=A0ACC1CGZ2_9NEOP|nr:hypothetical protein K1T71_013630 [Dendrolimus kikuchii]